MDFNLKGKAAIIGGSSKGLGKACAMALTREGVNVVLCARNRESLLWPVMPRPSARSLLLMESRSTMLLPDPSEPTGSHS